MCVEIAQQVIQNIKVLLNSIVCYCIVCVFSKVNATLHIISQLLHSNSHMTATHSSNCKQVEHSTAVSPGISVTIFVLTLICEEKPLLHKITCHTQITKSQKTACHWPGFDCKNLTFLGFEHGKSDCNKALHITQYQGRINPEGERACNSRTGNVNGKIQNRRPDILLLDRHCYC